MKQEIQQLVDKYFDQIVNWREHIHANPELSFQEYETSKFIKKVLTQRGIPFTDQWIETGIVATISGKNPSKRTIALRADIDALPIEEKNEVDYKSKNKGVMHACGHDVHTSNLLGVASVLNDIKDQFEGTVKLIFQPGEEKLPGGASLMIEQGVLEDPKPDAIIGLHVHPPLDVGTVGFRAGQYMASTDEIYLSVKGKGGHGALPHQTIDPIVIASNIIVSLQQIISRRKNPLVPAVLTFGKINSVGGATNVIPNKVKIQGTFRTYDEKWRKKAHKLIKRQANHIAKSMSGAVKVEIRKGYPSLINDNQLTAFAENASKEYLGTDHVVELPMIMTGEDFAFYSQKIPACFYRIGVKNEALNITSAVHTPTFDIDKEALKVSTGTMAFIAFQYLNES